MGKSRGGGQGGRTRGTVGPAVLAWERTQDPDRDREVGRVYGPDGALVIEREGGPTSIIWNATDMRQGGTLTHFHPGASGVGAALSDADIAAALSHGMTVRAFGADGSWAEVTADTALRYPQVVGFQRRWTKAMGRAIAEHRARAEGSGVILPSGERGPSFSVAQSYKDWNDRLEAAARAAIGTLPGVTYRRGGGRRG